MRIIAAEKKCAQQYVYKHYIDAVDSCLFAARIGGQSARATLGEIYFYGRGAAKDPIAAYRYALPPARDGDPRAQYIVGSILVARGERAGNMEEGRGWLMKAAENCHASAPPVISDSYMQSASADPFNAYIWNNVSMPQYAGSDLAKVVAEQRGVLATKLTPEERADGMRRAEDIRSTFNPKCR